MAEALVVRMPKLADTLVEGTLGQWLKRVGESVAAGEPLASIETDKVTTELTAPAGGIVLELLVDEGQTVPIETPIARLGDPSMTSATAAAAVGAAGAPAPGPAAPPGSARAAPAAAAPPDRQAGPPAPATATSTAVAAPSPAAAGPAASADLAAPGSAGPGGPGPRPTPVAARLLAAHGLPPAAVTVPPGARRLTKADVLRHLEQPAHASDALASSSPSLAPPSASAKASLPATASPPEAPSPGASDHGAGVLVPLSSMRRSIAEHMLAARSTIPHGLVVAEADLTELVAWREATRAPFEQTEGARLTLTVCFVAALGRALAEAGHQSVDLGVAVALERGLIVPVIRRVEELGLGETARALAELAGRARAARLAPADVRGGLMTITNVGSFNNLLAAPIVPLGQLGILGPGLVEQRPLPGPGPSVRIGWRCLLSLSFDRRALDDLAAERLLIATVAHLARLPSERGPSGPPAQR